MSTPRRMVIAGGTGMLGHRLAARWLAAGDAVTVLSRDPVRTSRRLPPGTTAKRWAPPTVDDDLVAELRGADAVVNLAGVPIGGRPWTPARKRAILESRLEATRTIIGWINRQRMRQLSRRLTTSSYSRKLAVARACASVKGRTIRRFGAD